MRRPPSGTLPSYLVGRHTDSLIPSQAGNGFYSTKRELKTTHEGVRDPSPADSRIWSIVNPAKQHYSSGHNVGYKIMCKDYVPLLPKDDSLVGRRAPFAKHALWTVPYEEGRLYPAGKFPTQTKKAPADSLEGWVSKGDSIANRDSESLKESSC